MATLDKGFTLRPASTSLLTIDSEDRFANYNESRRPENVNSAYDFVLANNKVLLSGFFTRLTIQQVVFPWTVPNINRQTNKILFSYNSGAGKVDVFIDFGAVQGFYTPVQLAALIQNYVHTIDASLAPFTMKYGTFTAPGPVVVNSPVFTYNSNAAGVSVAFSPVPNDTVIYPFPSTTKQLFDLLGFYGEAGTSGNTILIANTDVDGYPSYAQAIRYIDIVSPDLVQCASLHDGSSLAISRDSLCRLYIADIDSTNVKGLLPSNPLYAPAGTQPGTINYLPPIAKQIAWRANQNIGSSVRFQVFDDSGNLLASASPNSYADSTNWSMSLLVTEN